MEFCWKFYKNIKEFKVLFGLMLSLLVLNGVEPNYYEILHLKEGQTLHLENNQGQFEREIKTDTCQCGFKKVTRIVGGKETKVNEFPYMAGIMNENGQMCGASIISDQYIVTAAHCVYKENIKIDVVVGEHNVTTGKETNATKIYMLTNCTIHPEYNNKTNDNDIAVCKTVKSIEYNVEVGPVCLPFKHKRYSFVGGIVTSLGWGSLQFTDEKSDAFQKVDLQVVSPNKPSNRNDIMYTYTPGKDTCQMDDGGPLLWNDPNTNRYTLVGIISGIGCASNEFSINMRVGAFMDWIVSVTSDAQYCKIE